MKLEGPNILAVNGGSSSIRFAFFGVGEGLEKKLRGKLDRIGQDGTSLVFGDGAGESQIRNLDASIHRSIVDCLIDWLEDQNGFQEIIGIGHRLVHGMKHSEPILVTRELLDELRLIKPYDPEHLPREIELIEAFIRRHPQIPQYACFDTAFHRGMPMVAKLLPIPRKYYIQGVERYGFHGLSYSYLMEELHRLDPKAARGRVILAHLGSGASLAAVRDGKSMDTSMGFTPAAGLTMGTRSGDLDPGLMSYLARTEGMTADQFQYMVNHKSGLLGISETSSDMRDLVAREYNDVRAAEAVDFFCYQVRKWIGSFTAVLGGLDTLIFAGGIGENAPFVRSQICRNLGFLGIELLESQNADSAAVISKDGDRVAVRVIRTDEELMIARSVNRFTE